MRYWVKLWTEMLDDPKMGRLTDRQHRLCTNLFCLAGIIDDEGRLLNTDDIAYKVRRDVDSVAEDLAALAAVNIVEQVGGAWQLVHFDVRNERPPSSDSTERVRQYRERRKQAGMPAGYTYDPAVITAKYGRCVYCGSTDNLVVDHAYPIVLGGTDDPTNLVAACKKCNAGKAGRTPEQAGLRFMDAEAGRLYMEYKKTVTVTPQHDNSDSFHVTSPDKIRSEQDQKQIRSDTDTDPEQTTSEALAVVVGSLSGVLDAKTVEQELGGWPHPEYAAAIVAYARHQKDIKSVPAFVRAKLRDGWKPPGNGRDRPRRSLDGEYGDCIKH